jgi:hypothetical protein
VAKRHSFSTGLHRTLRAFASGGHRPPLRSRPRVSALIQKSTSPWSTLNETTRPKNSTPEFLSPFLSLKFLPGTATCSHPRFRCNLILWFKPLQTRAIASSYGRYLHLTHPWCFAQCIFLCILYFARGFAQMGFGGIPAIHRASSFHCGAPVHCMLRVFVPGANAPLHSFPRISGLHPKPTSTMG